MPEPRTSAQTPANAAANAERYRTLLEINNALITNLTRETLLHSIAEILRPIVPFDSALITIYNSGNDTLRNYILDAASSSDHFRAGVEFNRDDSVSGWVIEHQRAVMRGDLPHQQRYPNDRYAVADGLCSDCIVPLILRGKCIGTLNIGSTKRNQFSEADLELLQEVANQVALAVANMLSYEEIGALSASIERSRAERYRTLLEVNNAIVTHLNRDSLLPLDLRDPPTFPFL